MNFVRTQAQLLLLAVALCLLLVASVSTGADLRSALLQRLGRAQSAVQTRKAHQECDKILVQIAQDKHLAPNQQERPQCLEFDKSVQGTFESPNWEVLGMGSYAVALRAPKKNPAPSTVAVKVSQAPGLVGGHSTSMIEEYLLLWYLSQAEIDLSTSNPELAALIPDGKIKGSHYFTRPGRLFVSGPLEENADHTQKLELFDHRIKHPYLSFEQELAAGDLFQYLYRNGQPVGDLRHELFAEPVQGQAIGNIQAVAPELRMKVRSFRLQDLKKWMADIFKAIIVMHSVPHPWEHRDIRADNIFMFGNSHGSESHAKLGDVGMACMGESCVVSPSSFYFPRASTDPNGQEDDFPQFKPTPHDSYQDMFAIGSVWFNVLTGYFSQRLRCQDAKKLLETSLNKHFGESHTHHEKSHLLRLIMYLVNDYSSEKAHIESKTRRLRDPQLALRLLLTPESEWPASVPQFECPEDRHSRPPFMQEDIQEMFNGGSEDESDTETRYDSD